MNKLKTVLERQKELQAMLASPSGKKQLQELEAKCYAVSGKPKATKTSIITYILVSERAQGLIGD